MQDQDAHAKNFSLLHHSSSDIRLAPFYDMICTRAYPKLTSKMAMKIGNKYDVALVFPRQWEELCKNVGYRYISMKEIIRKQSGLILKYLNEEADALKAANYNFLIIDKIIKVVNDNIQDTLERFKDE